jgi:hypothetical protein
MALSPSHSPLFVCGGIKWVIYLFFKMGIATLSVLSVGPQVLYTKKIEIYTGDANFSPWTLVATHTHTAPGQRTHAVGVGVDNGRTVCRCPTGVLWTHADVYRRRDDYREGGGGGSEGDTTRRRP